MRYRFLCSVSLLNLFTSLLLFGCIRSTDFNKTFITSIPLLSKAELVYAYADGHLAWLDQEKDSLGIFHKGKTVSVSNAFLPKLTHLAWSDGTLFGAGVESSGVIKVFKYNVNGEGGLWHDHLLETITLDTFLTEYPPVQKENSVLSENRKVKVNEISLADIAALNGEKLAVYIENEGVLIFDPLGVSSLVKLDLPKDEGDNYRQFIQFGPERQLIYQLSYRFNKKGVSKTQLYIHDFIKNKFYKESEFSSGQAVFMGISEKSYAVFSKHSKDKDYLFTYYSLEDNSKSFVKSFSPPVGWQLGGFEISREGMLTYRVLPETVEFYLWK